MLNQHLEAGPALPNLSATETRLNQ